MGRELGRTKRVVSIKIWYDTKECSEEDITNEIEAWPDIEDVQITGSARATNIDEEEWED